LTALISMSIRFAGFREQRFPGYDWILWWELEIERRMENNSFVGGKKINSSCISRIQAIHYRFVRLLFVARFGTGQCVMRHINARVIWFELFCPSTDRNPDWPYIGSSATDIIRTCKKIYTGKPIIWRMAYCRRAAYSPMIHRYLTFHYGDAKVYSVVHKLSHMAKKELLIHYIFSYLKSHKWLE